MAISITRADLIAQGVNEETTRGLGLAVVNASSEVAAARQELAKANADQTAAQAKLDAKLDELAVALETSHNATTLEFGGG